MDYTTQDPLIQEIDRRIERLKAARELLSDAPDMTPLVKPAVDASTAATVAPTGRRRGRPRKNPVPEQSAAQSAEPAEDEAVPGVTLPDEAQS